MSEGLYINFFHGRNTVTEELQDWGFAGPLVGPCSNNNKNLPKLTSSQSVAR